MAAWFFFQRRRQNRIQNLNKLHLPYFCYSFLYYCTTNLICDRHVITILAPRYVLREHVFCSPCFVIKFYPFPVRCLKYTSWKVVTDGPALVTGCLFAAGLKGCPQASSHEGSLVHDEKSARENNIRCLSDNMLKRHLVESSD